MTDWESLLIERAKKRDQPSISDLLELYGSYTDLRKRFISAQLCDSTTPQNRKTTHTKNSNTDTKQVCFLQAKLSQLQQELTNSYRNKLNFDDSIGKLQEKIDELESEILEKDKTISKLERTISHLQSNKL
ncbi:Autophagy protein 16 (ATG16) family protein [Cryptosporidium meleagridis]|uniref:Autophagy protein 16 (ATG16) family protein n=1 Tax=Cryptosporidium meleagridis TaxID=93969 RepID=A0A2P4Z293_9CRYT|nr:Autophagy protein 16 (ATG16) family protein [Cryptosporidium meleagridis]